MKKLLFTLIVLVANTLYLNSQSLSELDKKSGYFDIKLGNSISSLKDKIVQDEKEPNLYLIKNVSEYQIENHVIDKIIIIVSNDDKKIIQNFTLMFVDKVDELIRKAKDTRLNLENRKKYLEEAQRLDGIGPEYNFYRKIFGDAFGLPSSKENGIEKWDGKKVILMCTNVDGVGICNFSIKLSEEELKKVKSEKAQKASSKF